MTTMLALNTEGLLRLLTETTQHSSLSHQSRGDNYQNRTKNKTWPEIAIELCT